MVELSAFGVRMVPDMCFMRTSPCFDGGFFCGRSIELFRGLFSFVICALRGLLLILAMGMSDFGWGLVPGGIFRVSSLCFYGGVF